MVREVEELAAKLCPYLFGELKAFVESGVPGILRGSTNRPRPAVPEEPVGWSSERAGVEPFLERSRSAGIRGAVRPGCKTNVARYARRQSEAALDGGEARKRPATEDLPNEIVSGAKERQIVDITEVEDIRPIPGRRPIVRLGATRILRRRAVICKGPGSAAANIGQDSAPGVSDG